MRALLVALALLLPGPVAAGCTGVPNHYRCTEGDGTRTDTRQLGPTSVTQGTDPATGATWEQRSAKHGRLTVTTGRGADGNRWRWHSQTIGGRTYTRGVDPSGRAFTQVCDRFRCY